MRLPVSCLCLFLILTLAACSSDPAATPPPTDAGPEVGGDVLLLPDVGTDAGTDTGADLGAVDAGLVDVATDQELPLDANPETSTPDAGGEGGVDAGGPLDVPEDRPQLPTDTGSDTGGDVGVDVVADRPTCTEGATECSNATTMRVCRGGSWTAIACGRSASGTQEVCTASSRACGLGSPPCTADAQCGYGYVACVAAVCLWRGTVACTDDLACEDVYGAGSPFRCVAATFHGQAVRVCQEMSYAPRPCVLDRQCPTGRRCEVATGLCVR